LRKKAATRTHDPNERPVNGVKFIGVWDTVAAYGSPLEEITLGFSRYKVVSRKALKSSVFGTFYIINESSMAAYT
jgi:hypothetical protein